jgi:hypothetical protein
MAITAVGGPNPAVLNQLQKQLAEDEQTLIGDVKVNAGEKTLMADQARITMDSAAISAEQIKEQQQATEQAQAAQTAQTNRIARTAALTGASTPADNSSTIDKYI